MNATKTKKMTATETAPKTTEQIEADLNNAITPREILSAAIGMDAQGMLTDDRYPVLNALVQAFDTYQAKLEWMARDLASEVEKAKTDGIPRVYSAIGSSSLWNDVPVFASRIETLRETLQGMVRNSDNTFFASIARRIAPRAW